MLKTSTIALVVYCETNSASLIDTLCDDQEIHFLETVLNSGESNPLEQLYEQRAQLEKQENDFGDYVEDLLSQPFLNPEIQVHGVQWFKSRIKIDQYQKSEREAAKVIAEYAYKIFITDPTKTDFFLASATSQVRIRIFKLPNFNDAAA